VRQLLSRVSFRRKTSRLEHLMADSKVCTACGVVLAADSDGDLCPDCVRTTPLWDEGKRDQLPETRGVEKLSPLPPDQVARVLNFAHVQVLGLLGKGGMGMVYKARQTHLDRVVALKILPPSPDRDILFEERFLREARALARLSHPNIVVVHDFGRSGDYCYFIMEYVDGVNLRGAIRSKQLRANEAMTIVPPICDALEYAHEEGIIHRDIKPENILLDRKGRVKIADFGLARLQRADSPHNWTITGTSQIMGTLHYMAPEQIERPLLVDHRADIYSLGVVLYEMLTGELPIGRFAPPSKKSNIDARLDEVVLKALEKDPDHRFQSAGEIKKAIERISTSSLPPSPQLAPPPPVSRATVTPRPVPRATPAQISAPIPIKPPPIPIKSRRADEVSTVDAPPELVALAKKIRTLCHTATLAGALLFVYGIVNGDLVLFLAPSLGCFIGGPMALFVNWRSYRLARCRRSSQRQAATTALDRLLQGFLTFALILLAVGIALLFATAVIFVIALTLAAQAVGLLAIRRAYNRGAQPAA
jgi:serine/threonine protein kinase